MISQDRFLKRQSGSRNIELQTSALDSWEVQGDDASVELGNAYQFGVPSSQVEGAPTGWQDVNVVSGDKSKVAMYSCVCF